MIFKLVWRPLNQLSSLLARSLIHSFSGQEYLSRNSIPCNDLSSQELYMELSQKFYEAMKACGSVKSSPIALKLHGQLISSGLYSSIFLQNNLINMFLRCGNIDDACRIFDAIENPNVFSWNTMINGLADCGRIKEANKLFDEMPERDSISWNSMMSGYFHNGKPENTIKVFVSMIQDGKCFPDQFSLSCAMKACGFVGCIKWATQLHCLAIKVDFESDNSLETSIIDMYIKCNAVDFAELMFSRIQNPSLFCWNSLIYGYSKSHGVNKARDMFKEMPIRDSVSWNTMISILSQHGFAVNCLSMLVEMCNQGFRPNFMTYASAFSACSSTFDLQWGMHLHARVLRMEQSLDVFVGSGLIDMYAKCGRLESARQVFNNLIECNTVSWTSLIGAMSQFGHKEEALTLFNQMRNVPVDLDEFTLATVLGVCSSQKYIFIGDQLHSYIIKSGMNSSIPVGNAIITMYAKCDNARTANYAFELMPKKDIISWTTMLVAYSQSSEVEKARDCFDKMPERNVVTWNSMLSTYAQNGFEEDGLKLYRVMRREGVNPDWVTFASSISACANLAILKLGIQILAESVKFGFVSNVSVANSVVTMFSRCGRVEEARKVFDSICTKSLISWNAMMAGYAQNGQGRKVIEIFENMLKTDCTPDHISYVSVLSGCSHSGLVKEGEYYFNSMTKNFRISPTYEHYSSMVDLLGRAGLLEEAKDLIAGMPCPANSDVWGALLGACRIHHNTELAEIAMRNLLKLDLGDSGGYVLLANIYSDSGKFEGVADMRKLMREKRVRKNIGCSWIEVGNCVHVFTVDDTNHPETMFIHKMLKDINKMVENARRFISACSSANSHIFNNEMVEGY